MIRIISRYILLFLLTSCYTITKISSPIYYYSNDILFEISKIEEKLIISDEPRSNGSYKSDEADKFVIIQFAFFNKSKSNQEFNLNNLFLFNPSNNTQYRADWIISSGLLVKIRDKNFEIKENKMLKKTIVFIFPKKEIPKFLKLNDEIIEIKNKSSTTYL